MLSLNTIKPAKGSTKKRKRVGRGNASGHGTTATRGTKGQKSRSGVSRMKLKRLGMKSMIFSTPKSKGFKSSKLKAQVINLVDINKFFKDNEVVSPKSLFKKGLITAPDLRVKILGKGELKIKGLKLEGVEMSETAKKALGSR